MGVSHLRRDAKVATAGKAAGDTHASPRSQQVAGDKPFTFANGGTTRVPTVPSVGSFENKAVKPGNKTSQPPKGNMNGGRAGAKSGQEKVGTHKATGHPMSGGEMY